VGPSFKKTGVETQFHKILLRAPGGRAHVFIIIIIIIIIIKFILMWGVS